MMPCGNATCAASVPRELHTQARWLDLHSLGLRKVISQNLGNVFLTDFHETSDVETLITNNTDF
jgi:hypothetical protein